ncbi:hypothetical protein, partial [Endozoicomonas sp.]|uniref:hypothetical protein n=1 Tax=Endozoicomonas sp. TaxID=1892382 RepID=UPI00383A29D3
FNPPRSHALRGSARTQPQTRFLWLAMHSHAERGNEVPGGFCDSLLRGDDGYELICPLRQPRLAVFD